MNAFGHRLDADIARISVGGGCESGERVQSRTPRQGRLLLLWLLRGRVYHRRHTHDLACRPSVPLERLVLVFVGFPADDEAVRRLSEVYVEQLAEDVETWQQTRGDEGIERQRAEA